MNREIKEYAEAMEERIINDPVVRERRTRRKTEQVDRMPDRDPALAVASGEETITYSLVDPSAPGPKRSTDGSAGIDLFARVETRIPSIFDVNVLENPVRMIPLNLRATPENKDLFIELFSRSSLCINYGLLQGNSVGVIDFDFSNEFQLLVVNITKHTVVICAGEKIAQFIPTRRVNVRMVEGAIGESAHTGFGSTGKK